MPVNDLDTLYIGIDDTDSAKGMCTTFLAYKIACMLKRQNVEFLDFPGLVRFNPNIPWKTRGNGAVSLKIRTQNTDKARESTLNMVEKYSDVKNGANPGLVFFEGNTIPDELSQFSDLALWQLVCRAKARHLAARHGLDFFCQGNGQGLVGAIGAIGYSFNDHTLELLSYRKRSNFGKKRPISAKSVKIMHEKTSPGTFGSFDADKHKVLIAPHGPDPVFCGIRGEDSDSVLCASRMLKMDERLDGYMIFKSNQGTGDHLRHTLAPDQMRPYWSGMLVGVVMDKPEITRGGHVFFTVSVKGGKFRCAVYRPTGMSYVALGLVPGDKICIGGGIRKASKNHPRVFNAELIRILDICKPLVWSNPVCKDCSKSMKSKGVGQGYQCVRCKKRSYWRQASPLLRTIKRKLYLPTVSAHRHLTRPMQRTRKNRKSEFGNSIPWICEY